MIFSVPGQPVGKARARVIRNGAYTPQKTKDYQQSVREYANIVKNDVEYDQPIKIKLTMYYKIPKSTSKKKRAMMMNHEIRPMVKPDMDNVEKAILDALNKVIYNDDSQVVECVKSKWYSDTPCVLIEITNVR